MKGGEEMGGVVVEVVDAGDEPKEVSVYVFLLGTPEFLAAFINNSVLVGVFVSGEVASRGGEEVWEKFDFNKEREWLGGGRWDGGDGGGDDRRVKVFDGDVLEGDVLEGVVV
jgi:hypothetical protein